MIAVLVTLLMAGIPAQAPGDVRLAVTVVDQTGAVIPNATVTVTPSTDPKTPVAPVRTGEKGVATLQGLSPGRYSIQAEFSGFEPRLLKDVQLKSGDNKHVVVLALQGVQDSVTVVRDAREAASDRRSTFGTAMTREQIDALSDDPDEMAQQLQDMAGGNAVIRVDSFEGGRLPPKSAIKAIHITRDAFAAENHYAGGLFIDIITQPGIGPLRTNLNMRLRDGSMSGKNQLAADKGPERTQNYNGGFGGSLIKQKASFSINVNTLTQFDTPVLLRTGSSTARWSTRSAPRRPTRQRRSCSACSTTRSPAIRPCASTSTGTTARPAMPASAATTPSSAATRPRTRATTCESRRRGRSAAGSSSTRARHIGWSDTSNRFGVRGPDDPGARRVHDRRRSS